MTRTQTMDVLLEVLNERVTVASRDLPMLAEKTSREVLERTASEWAQENLIRDIDGELDWGGLIMASVIGALGEEDPKVRRRRLLNAAAHIVAAVEGEDE